MAAKYRRSGYRGKGRYPSRGYDAGHEAARRHIQEAQELSVELGGMDKEVKEFFFNLRTSQFEKLLERYGQKYGEDTRQYAQVTFPKWKAGTTQMSGLVAGRLFDLLPPVMPIDLKLRIVEGLWENQGPKGTEYVLVPHSMSAESVHAYVSANLFSYVENQSISDKLKDRFNWLSGEDAKVAEQLLRHARSIQLNLKQRIASAIMARAEEVAATNRDVVHGVVSTITIGRHSVSIKRSEYVSEPGVTDQYRFNRGGAPVPESKGAAQGYGWVLWLIGIAVVIFFLSRR